ncbi:Crp/Fnr family transcriptional regulator [Fundidesulfovibrio butyratiphilus]
MVSPSSATTLSVLAKVPLFSSLSGAQLATLEGNSAVIGYDRGQMIFFEGVKAKGLFVVLSGQVKIYKASPEGKEQILHVLGPGEPFAEAPVFQGAKYPASAMAIAASRVLFIEKDVLTRLMERDVGLAMAMLAALSLRLRQMAAMIGQLTLRELPARLAGYLLLRAEDQDRDTFALDISKGHLAGLLGSTREALSRTLARLADAGLIAMDNRTITLLDKERLESLAEGEAKLR